MVFNIDKLLDEKEAIESNAPAEEIHKIRTNIVMTGNTKLKVRK